MNTGQATYSSAIADASNYTRWIINELRPHMGKGLLEIGLGHGSYRALLPEDITYIGMDMDGASVERARDLYPNDEFFMADITSTGFLHCLQGAKVDTILCVNVLEHIERDVLAIENLLAVLPSGGHLLLFVPAFQALYTELDSLAGHCRRYRNADMRRIIDERKAEILITKYFNPLGGLGWWLNGLVHHESLDNSAVNGQISFFDKYLLPISRILTPVTSRWFGQSLICVSRKR